MCGRERRARPKIQQYNTIRELVFWICTACGGADVIRILNFDDEQDDSEDEKKTKDMNHST